MKKLISFIMLFCCMTAMADKIEVSTTLPNEGKPEHVYLMMSGSNVYSNALTAPTQTPENYGLFAFYAAQGKKDCYFIYSKKASKWLTYTKGASYNNGKDFVKFTDLQKDAQYFKIYSDGNDGYNIQPVTTSGGTDKYLNWHGGVSSNPYDGENTLGLWQSSASNDSGSRWLFTEEIIIQRTYSISIPDGETIKIGNDTYADGDTYTIEGSLPKSNVTVVAPEGKFAAVAIDDINQTINVYFATLPEFPACAEYTNAVLYPAQQQMVGKAEIAEKNGVYTLKNNVLAAAYMKLGNAIYFAGSNTMNLLAGSEIFSVAFGNGDNVPASAMTLKDIEVQQLDANPEAIGGAEHFAGVQIVANYEYTYKERNVAIVWRAVLRDGSHYLRTEMELTGIDDVDMYNVIPLMYNVDTKAAGSTPKSVGNTRGAVLMSDKIFAGLEHPVAYNTVGGASGDEDNWKLTTTMDAVSLTAESWEQVAEKEVPERVTEATGAGYPNVYAYKQKGVELLKNQKVEVKVEYTSGSHRLNFGGADLISSSGSIAASDYHSGYSGTNHDKNTFSFVAPYDGTFDIRVIVQDKSESIDASSTLTTKIYTAKEGVVINSDVVGIEGRWSRNTTLQKGETWKISGVVGLIAQDGTQANENIHKTQKRRSFLAYSERERAVPWRAFPCYISWYELNINRNNAEPGKEHTNFTSADIVDVLENWKKNFYDRYENAPAAFIIDDGWDNYGTWTFHSGFPNEMRDMTSLSEEMGAGVGAWLGPVGGYGQSGNYRRNYWSSKGGMQLSNPAYYQTFKDAAYNLVKNQGDYRFFKFDGISAQFSAVGPDAGDTGNENAEGIIRLERYVREELREDIFFNTTVGTWASPFWYQYTDATWRQENDYGEEGGSNSIDRERWITYRDRLVYQNYVTNSPICPINTLMTHGFILSTFGSVSRNFDYEVVRREMRCAFVCGSGMVELYNDYALMNSINNGKLWADLAECIAWQKRNADVLPDAHWVGGNPWNGQEAEIYGWASWNGTKSTLALRNGGNTAKSYTFTLREALNIPANINGSIILRSSFTEQAALEGLVEGTAINIDEQLTVKLPGSTVYSFDGIDAAATVTPVKSITLASESNENSVPANRTLVIKASLNPTEATYPVISWNSSNPEVATVSGGLITPLKEGETVITATANDGSGVTASITITVTEKIVEPYSTNFDKNANPTGTDRYIKNIIFAEEGADTQTIAVGVAKPYIDKSADKNSLLTCTPGSTITVTFDKQANWMNSYVYIDLDNDMQFSFNDGSTDQLNTDVVSFSFYTGSFTNESKGVNSAGETLTGDARNTMVCPPFKAPAKEGDYRIRFKMDWNSIDAGGQIAADGTCTGHNGFLANRGSIVDATLRVIASTDIEDVIGDSETELIYDLTGNRLDKTPAKGIFIKNNKKMIQ